MKINSKYFLCLILVWPHCALFQNTKYEVSNITQTLILASSPFLHSDGSGQPPIEYGSPPDLTGEQDQEEEALPEESKINEVRVKAPIKDGALQRNPKALHNSYFEYENQKSR